MKSEPEFMQYLTFSDSEEHLDLSKTRCLVIDQQYHDIEKFWDYFAEGLDFPGYFGRNWNAFFDCLSSATDMLESDVVLIHETLPFPISSSNNMAYINCLADSKMDPPRKFSLTVTFRHKLRSQIIAAAEQAG